MTEIDIKISIPKGSEQIPLIRALIRVIGLAKHLLRKVEKGEEV